MPKRGAKKLPSGLEDQKRAGSKNFWCNLGKALGPPSGHPRKFLIHAQSWLKSAVDFPLNRNFRCPKRPPLGSKRVFFKLGYLGVRYCPPWPSFVKIRRPPSVQSGPVRAGKPVNSNSGKAKYCTFIRKLATKLCRFAKDPSIQFFLLEIDDRN